MAGILVSKVMTCNCYFIVSIDPTALRMLGSRWEVVGNVFKTCLGTSATGLVFFSLSAAKNTSLSSYWSRMFINKQVTSKVTRIDCNRAHCTHRESLPPRPLHQDRIHRCHLRQILSRLHQNHQHRSGVRVYGLHPLRRPSYSQILPFHLRPTPRFPLAHGGRCQR